MELQSGIFELYYTMLSNTTNIYLYACVGSGGGGKEVFAQLVICRSYRIRCHGIATCASVIVAVMLLIRKTGTIDVNHRYCNISQVTEPYQIHVYQMHFLTHYV